MSVAPDWIFIQSGATDILRNNALDIRELHGYGYDGVPAGNPRGWG